MWLAPEKNGEKDLQLSFSEFKQIGRAWGELREITFYYLCKNNIEMIDVIVEFWEKHSLILGIITSCTTIFGFFAAIYFYKKTKIVRLLTYNKKTTSFFNKEGENITGIAVTYNGESINSLYITELLFYNQSSDVLKKDDLVNGSFSVYSEARIFDVVVLESKKESAIKTKDLENKLNWTIDFDYLNKGDSFRLRVVHEKDDIKISSELRGGKIEMHQLSKIKRNLLKMISPKFEIDKETGQLQLNFYV